MAIFILFDFSVKFKKLKSLTSLTPARRYESSKQKRIRFCIHLNSNNYRIFVSLMNGDETPSKWDKIAKAPLGLPTIWYVFSVRFISSRLIFTKGISSSPVTDPFLTIADCLSLS